MDGQTLETICAKRMPHGVRMAWPMEVLLPRITEPVEEPEECYEALLRAVEMGMVSEECYEIAAEWSWFPRWKEYVQCAFFAEASARCYELLMPPEEGGKVAQHTRTVGAVNAMRYLTGQTLSDLMRPEGE